MPRRETLKRKSAAIAIRQLSRSTGASRIVLGQIKTLSAMGFEVFVLCEKPNWKEITSSGGRCIKITRWPFKGKARRFWFNSRVKKWCKANRPSILISHGDSETPDILYMHNCIHLAHERKYKIDEPSTSEVSAIHDRILKGNQYRHIIANSQLMAKDLSNRYSIDRKKIKVHYPFYDDKKFNPTTANNDRHIERSNLGVGEDQVLISLVTSGDFAVRNVNLFIEIAAQLTKESEKSYKFLVVGKDDATQYQELASQLGISNKFIWTSTSPKVEAIYGATDILVLPAYIETFCCVALEAMACGKPVLMSSWIGASELVREDLPELVIHDYEVSSWCERIEKMVQEKSIENLGMKAHEIVSKFSDTNGNDPLKNLLQTSYSQMERRAHTP